MLTSKDKRPAKVLLVGGTGFVGTHLAKELHNRGINFSIGLRRSDSKFSYFSNFFITGDLNDQFDWSPYLNNQEVVIYLAGRAHISGVAADAIDEYRKINRDAAVKCAEQAVMAGVEKFIYISTIKVNGEVTVGNELISSASTLNPQDAYAKSKAEAEEKLLSISKNASMQIIIIRPPLVYGPGVKANFLKIIRWINLGIPLPLLSIYKNRRSLVSVFNLVDLIINCIHNKKTFSGVFLVSDGFDVSTSQLLTAMYKVMRKQNKMFYFPVSLLRLLLWLTGNKKLSNQITNSLRLDISETINRLSWTPPISLEEGLRLTVEESFEEGSKNEENI